MIPRIREVFLSLCLVTVAFISCHTPDNDKTNEENNSGQNSNNNPPATVNFVNHTTFKVDIYKNLNPDYFDPTTLVCTVDAGTTKEATLYASTDQTVGDTFYPRYKVLLADSIETGTSSIYVDTQRNLSNISFVVEKGKTYTKSIPQPLADELKFVNGYIAVQNLSSTQVQILKADDILHKLDDKGIYLNPVSQFPGYYEIPISWFEDTLTINQLKAFSNSYVNFPEFVMERGKLYSFKINNTNAIDPPAITKLPLKN
ncbi:MAG: hypothetical protein LBB81_11895 [Treponema sp.]|jgi:hypothetical protein|nr:hypothetical protein [Treponema sp.]